MGNKLVDELGSDGGFCGRKVTGICKTYPNMKPLPLPKTSHLRTFTKFALRGRIKGFFISMLFSLSYPKRGLQLQAVEH